MASFRQIVRDPVVAVHTAAGEKEIDPFFIHKMGIRMKGKVLDVVMAVHAGRLPVGGNVELPLVQEPRGLNTGSA